MNNKIFYFILLLPFLTCNKYDGPSHETIKSYNFSFYSNETKTMAGSYFADSIRLYVNGIEHGIGQTGLKAILTVESGGGAVDNSNLEIVNGYAATKWKAGNQNNLQQIRADIYKQNGDYVGSTNLKAFAFRKGSWDMIQLLPDVQILDILADTINKKTWMITSYGLFAPIGQYFNWVQQSFPQTSPFSLNMDKSGVIYMTTRQGQILKSTNGGGFWNICTSPVPGHPYYYYTTVCNNGYIYASTPDYANSLRCSRDGGNTWSADTTGLDPGDLVGDVYQLNNGDILFHSSSYLNLYKSVDDGRSWKKMEAPAHSTKLYVTKNEDLILFNQDNGVSIYKSTDLGKTFKKVYSVWPAYRTSLMDELIQLKEAWYYILVPGYGIIRTTDFEQFETFWANSEVLSLFQTYDGVLISKGYSNSPVYYFRD